MLVGEFVGGVSAFDGQAGLIRGIAAEVVGIIGMDGWDQLVCRAVWSLMRWWCRRASRMG
jgi:hypothetical protein